MAIGITAFAAFWNVLGTVGPIYMLVNEPFRPGNLIALIFPLIGLLMAWYALVLWRRYLYWGESILQLEQFPPRLGTLLKGQIKLNRMINGSTPVSLKLMCESVTVTGTGKSRSTRRNTPLGHANKSRWQRDHSHPGFICHSNRHAGVLYDRTKLDRVELKDQSTIARPGL